MRTLLYITANSKPEKESSCKTVGRELVDAVLRYGMDVELQEIDLYDEHIPQLKGCYFEGRSAVLSEDARNNLSLEEQREVEKIEALCDQFRQADIYILAAPMWSLSFPAPVKEYLDCVMQVGKTIEFTGGKPNGLLDNKQRHFVYVQSSGAEIPLVLRPTLNRGLNYVRDMMHTLGITNFHELLVDGTGETEEERNAAIENALEKVDALAQKLVKE